MDMERADQAPAGGEGGRGRRILKVAAWLAGALLVVGATWLIVKGLFTERATKKPAAQQIVMVKPLPPPPPPPPPPKVPPKPPEQKTVEQRIDPAPKPQQQSEPAPDPGVGTKGGAGPDGGTIGDGSGFGTGTKAAEAPKIGERKRDEGELERRYRALLQQHVSLAMSRNKDLRAAGDFKLVVNVWIRPDGTVERYQLVADPGRPELANLLATALAEIPPAKQAFPKDLPQPTRIVVTNRF